MLWLLQRLDPNLAKATLNALLDAVLEITFYAEPYPLNLILIQTIRTLFSKTTSDCAYTVRLFG